MNKKYIPFVESLSNATNNALIECIVKSYSVLHKTTDVYNDKYISFLEAIKCEETSELVNVLTEGYRTIHKPANALNEGIGDTIRNTYNKAKNVAHIAKEAAFGTNEEQSFRNKLNNIALNSDNYNSYSSSGESAINAISELINTGTRDPNLPSKIVDIIRKTINTNLVDGIDYNPAKHPAFVRDNKYYDLLDKLETDLTNIVVKVLPVLGKIKLDDDRFEEVANWWDKNIVPKFGKYYSLLSKTELDFSKVVDAKSKKLTQKPKVVEPEIKEEVKELKPAEPERQAPKAKSKSQVAPVQPELPAKPKPKAKSKVTSTVPEPTEPVLKKTPIRSKKSAVVV